MVVEQPQEPPGSRRSRLLGTEEPVPKLKAALGTASTPSTEAPQQGFTAIAPAAPQHVRAGTIIQQPTVCLEQRAAIIGGSAVNLRRSVQEIPFEIEFKLQEPCLLTEVEVLWDQSAPYAVRFEVCVDDVPVAVQWSGQARRASGELLQCRLQLDEPKEQAQTCVLCIFANDHVSGRRGLFSNAAMSNAQDFADSLSEMSDRSEDWIHIAEIVPRGLPAGSAPPRRRLLRPPAYWGAPDFAGPLHRRVEVPPGELGLEVFQRLLDDTWKGQATRDRRGALPKRLLVRGAQRVEALPLWNRFSRCRRQLLKAQGEGSCTPLLDLCGGAGAPPIRTDRICESAPQLFGPCERRANEHYLFHGTSPTGALGIIREGFDIRRAGKRSALLFGPGAYFAEASSKSDEYAAAEEFSGLCAVLVCRVLCGEMYRALRRLDPQAGFDERVAEKYDGVLGDREASVGTYREFVVFREDQVYPEYLVLYNRQF